MNKGIPWIELEKLLITKEDIIQNLRNAIKELNSIIGPNASAALIQTEKAIEDIKALYGV
jgi:hypothetical protein